MSPPCSPRGRSHVDPVKGGGCVTNPCCFQDFPPLRFGDHFHLHLSSLILPTFNPVGHSTENMQYFALSPILTINEGIWEQISSICRVFTSYQALCYPSSPFGRQMSIAGEAPTPVHFSSLSTPLSKPPPTHTHLRIQIGSSLQLFTPSLSWLNWSD